MTHLLQQSLDQADPGAGSLIVQLLQRSIEQNDQILREHAELKATIANHTMNEESLVAGFAAAFPKKPNGEPDFEGHELYHSALIDESRARTVFYRDLRQELIKKGLWSLVMIMVALVTYWWGGQMRGLH